MGVSSTATQPVARPGIGSHTRTRGGAKDEWLTPPELIEALGPFDLDPCSPATRPWPTAARHLTVDDDGLASPWPANDLVWCNPPYGAETWAWLRKLARHPAGGIALVFARTETVGFQETVWAEADAIVFLAGRLRLHHVDGTVGSSNSGGPSCLVAYGSAAAERLLEVHAAGRIAAGAMVNTADISVAAQGPPTVTS